MAHMGVFYAQFNGSEIYNPIDFMCNFSDVVLLACVSGIKLFECEICKQKFSSNVALTEHVARHTDSRPHKCEQCGRMFRQVSRGMRGV